MSNQSNNSGDGHRKSTDNLRPPWKKGESGNPKGRPPGIRYLSEAVKAKLPLVLPEEEKAAKGEGREPQTNVDVLADAVIRLGKNGNPAALGLIHDWLEGKARQPVSLIGEMGLVVVKDNLTAAKRRMARLKRLEDGEVDDHGEAEE